MRCARAFSFALPADRSQIPAVPAREFLHRLSLQSGTADLVPTTREALRAQSFVDGRSDFAAGPVVRRSVADFVSAVRDDPARLRRYIFHVSFCGSTLLSRLLDVPGRALALREPNCLADLANQRAAQDAGSPSCLASTPALAAIESHLFTPWAEGEAVLVKPSNWANLLLPELCAEPAAVRPIFLTTTRAAFVGAVIRGGPERIAYTARSAAHLSSARREDAEYVAAALARETDERGKVAALSAVAHEIQLRQFARTAGEGGWGAGHWLTLDELTGDPLASARKGAAALSLAIPDEELAESVMRWSARHSKQPERTFSREQQSDHDRRIRETHGDVVASALEWAHRTFGD